MVILGGAGSTSGPVIGASSSPICRNPAAPAGLAEIRLWRAAALVMFVMPLGIVGTAVRCISALATARRVPMRTTARPIEVAIQAPAAGQSRSAELVASDLTVRFGGLTALDNVSLRVKPGESTR